MFYQIFLSPQVKRYSIITYKNGIKSLPSELPNEIITPRKILKFSSVEVLIKTANHKCNRIYKRTVRLAYTKKDLSFDPWITFSMLFICAC